MSIRLQQSENYKSDKNNNRQNISCGIPWPADNPQEIELFRNLRLELLNNKFASLPESMLRDICKEISHMYNNEFSSAKKNYWLRIVRRNNIRYNHMIALKTLSCAKNLRSHFNRCFIANMATSEYISNFRHLNQALRETFTIFTNVASKSRKKWHKPQCFYQSIRNLNGFTIDNYFGKRNGLLMVTNDLHNARIQANRDGIILILKLHSEGSEFGALDMSWIDEFPDEKNWILFNHCVEIIGWIMCNDYDRFTPYFHELMRNKYIFDDCKEGEIWENNNQKLLNMNVCYILRNLQLLRTKEEHMSIEGVLCEKTVCNFFAQMIGDRQKIEILKFLLQIAYHELSQNISNMNVLFPCLSSNKKLRESINRYSGAYLHSIHEQIHYILENCHEIRLPIIICHQLTADINIESDIKCRQCLVRYLCIKIITV